MNTGLRRRDRHAAPPAELKELVPQIDLTGGGRYPVLGASHHVEAATARHDRVAWAFASGATARGVHVIQHTPVTGLAPRRRPGRRRRDAARADRRGVVLSRRRRPGHPVAGDGRRPPAGPDPPAPRVRHERLRAGLRDDPRLDRARLLRLPDRARPDAHRRRVRRPALVLAPVVVRRAAQLRLQDHPPAAVPARHADPAHVGRHLRHLGRLQPDHGRHRRRRASSSRPAGGRGASRRSRPAARRWPSSSRPAGRRT